MCSGVSVEFVMLYMLFLDFFFFLMVRPPPRSPPLYSSAASDVYRRQDFTYAASKKRCRGYS